MRAHPRVTVPASAALALALAALPPLVAIAAEDDLAAIRAFEDRVSAYASLRRTEEKKLPPLAAAETDAATIRAHDRALGEAVRRARAGARPGDVFVPAVRPVLRRLVDEELRGDPAQQRTVHEGNPEKVRGAPPVEYAVNASYPEGAPWSTVPPALLARLPRLPDDLQYRFSGRHLLLVDTRARLVVDFLGQAAPR